MSRIISRKKKGDKQEEKDKGVRRLIYLLVFVVLLLAVMIVLPLIQNREHKAEAYACTLAIRRAQDAVLVEFYSDPEMTQQDAAVVVDKSKLAREDLCPSNGDYYLVPVNGGGWRVTCGLHEEDTILRTRINASRVMDELQSQLASRKRLEMDTPSNLIMNINGIALDVTQLPGDNALRRGTDYSIDFDGVVCFFSLNADEEVNWFVYADENHAAVWKASSGWSGDAYPQ
ncbi:MAG: hypothetical protein IKN89_06455 [Oscillospiraceae bacterium]|nr:hypothetical protein [Oscillospiraceae bacterium]